MLTERTSVGGLIEPGDGNTEQAVGAGRMFIHVGGRCGAVPLSFSKHLAQKESQVGDDAGCNKKHQWLFHYSYACVCVCVCVCTCVYICV